MGSAATVLSLFCEDHSVSQLLANGLRAGTWVIDAELIQDAFRNCDVSGKIELVGFELAFLLPQQVFQRLFLEAARHLQS